MALKQIDLAETGTMVSATIEMLIHYFLSLFTSAMAA